MSLIDASISDIQHQLAICMSWCGDRCAILDSTTDLSHSFRSDSLATLAAAVFPESCHTPYSPDLTYRFARFTAERERLVGSNSIDPVSEYNRQRSLLLVNWQSSLFDGAVVPETRGFIDDDYIPAWDTWLSIVRIETDYGTHGLLCWIPESLADNVDMAIRVDPASCLTWCETRQTMLKHRSWGKGFTEC